jgi:integrase
MSTFAVPRGAGGDIFDVKNQVGHSDIRTTINTYGHIFEEDSLDLAQKMDVALNCSGFSREIQRDSKSYCLYIY